MAQLLDFLSANPWAFKVISLGCGLGALIIIWDLFFGIHWIRDLLIPLAIVGFFIYVFISA